MSTHVTNTVTTPVVSSPIVVSSTQARSAAAMASETAAATEALAALDEMGGGDGTVEGLPMQTDGAMDEHEDEIDDVHSYCLPQVDGPSDPTDGTLEGEPGEEQPPTEENPQGEAQDEAAADEEAMDATTDELTAPLQDLPDMPAEVKPDAEAMDTSVSRAVASGDMEDKEDKFRLTEAVSDPLTTLASAAALNATSSFSANGMKIDGQDTKPVSVLEFTFHVIFRNWSYLIWSCNIS